MVKKIERMTVIKLPTRMKLIEQVRVIIALRRGIPYDLVKQSDAIDYALAFVVENSPKHK
jgi:hypothetical protein